MVKYIEEGTNYAYTIERIENITFTKLRAVAIDFTRRLPSSLTDELYKDMQHGVCQLQSEPALNMYLYSFGLMHEAKLQHAFQHLPSDFTDHEAIEIIDYGCGQAIGTICYADFLRKIGKTQKVKKVTLIEPSKRALERAALHTSCFLPEAEIVTINKGFDDLVEDDLCIDEEIPTLHIFSNVLDLADDYFDLEKFAVLVNNCTRGENYFVSVSPYFDYGEKDEQPYRFFKLLDIKPYYSKIRHSGEFIDGKDWTCHILIGVSNNDYSGYNNISAQQLKTLISNGAKCFKGYKINDITYVDKVVNISFATPINGYVLTTNEIGASVKNTSSLSIPLSHIRQTFINDDDLNWLGNTIIFAPFTLNRLLNGALVDILQQYIRKGEEYINIFDEDDNTPYIYPQDTIVNNFIKIRLTNEGLETAENIAKLIMGFSIEDIELIMEFAKDADDKEEYKDAFKYYKFAASSNSSEAQYMLGYYYSNGLGVSQDEFEAVRWYRKAAELGHIDAQYSLALCYSNGNGIPAGQCYAIAAQWYLKAAKKGHIYAQNNLGALYYNGQGLAQNYSEAVKYFRTSAESGNSAAQYNLGLCYENGDGVLQSDADAIKWYIKAAMQGDKKAEEKLPNAKSYYSKDAKYRTSNIKWLIEAANQGLVLAQYKLGVEYENPYGATGRDYKEAIKWYRKAAEQEYVAVYETLGDFYYTGIGVKKDYTEAFKWYKKAASNDYIHSQNRLAECYEKGNGVTINYTDAVKWYLKSSKMEASRAKLVELYALGLGVEKSTKEALKWAKCCKDDFYWNRYKSFRIGMDFYTKQIYEDAVMWFEFAAEKDDSDAQYMLGKCYENGYGIKQSYTDAIKWYSKSLTLDAMFSLGNCYRYGKGVKRSYFKAVKWYVKACKIVKNGKSAQALEEIYKINRYYRIYAFFIGLYYKL